jgi:hypothetical protein
VYSIIDSKVFGVTFGVNFLFPIVEQRFNVCTMPLMELVYILNDLDVAKIHIKKN